MGPVAVPVERLWGAQTQRSLQNFKIGDAVDILPIQVIHALAVVKKCCAKYNKRSGVLQPYFADAIMLAADEVIAGRYDHEFPLVVFQAGSGTRSNMNMNEVLASRANEILGVDGEARLSGLAVHPRVERFDRRGTEPFEPFEFFQNGIFP